MILPRKQRWATPPWTFRVESRPDAWRILHKYFLQWIWGKTGLGRKMLSSQVTWPVSRIRAFVIRARTQWGWEPTQNQPHCLGFQSLPHISLVKRSWVKCLTSPRLHVLIYKVGMQWAGEAVGNGDRENLSAPLARGARSVCAVLLKLRPSQHRLNTHSGVPFRLPKVIPVHSRHCIKYTLETIR